MLQVFSLPAGTGMAINDKFFALQEDLNMADGLIVMNLPQKGIPYPLLRQASSIIIESSLFFLNEALCKPCFTKRFFLPLAIS